MYWGLIRCHLQFDHYVSRQPNVIEDKATTYAQIYTYILNFQSFRCDTYIFHRRGRSIFLKQITSVLVPSLFFLRNFLKKLPHFPNYLPRFWKKLRRFSRKLRCFSRNLPAFLDNLRHSRGIWRWSAGNQRSIRGDFYTIGTKPKDQALEKCHKLLPQPEVGSLPRWAFSRQHSGDCSPHFNPCTTVYSSPYTTL